MRNRYLDTLRAAAIVRVVVYHHFGWAWLSLAFPAMGVMFAVAGSLTAASLAGRSADTVVLARLRRLLPPVWLLGLVTVPLMLRAGWAAETGGAHPFRPENLIFWLLPLGDPPGSDDAAFVWDALWYVRTYLWLVVLSPLLYPLYRGVGWPMLAVPLLGMALLQRGDYGMPPAVESALWDLTTYGACWLAGFAHRDGRLGRAHPALIVAAAVALAGLGLHWLVQGRAETGWDLGAASEAQAVYSLAAVLLLPRWEPPARWLPRGRLAGVVSVLNARAVTVYLWHGVAIAAVWPVLERTGMDDLGALESSVPLVVTVVLTVVAVIAFGWAEDLAARRRPRLWPSTGGPGNTGDTAGPGGLAGPGPASTPGAGPPSGFAPAPGSVPAAGSGSTTGFAPAFGPLPAGWPEVPGPGLPSTGSQPARTGAAGTGAAGTAAAGTAAAGSTRAAKPRTTIPRAVPPRAGSQRAGSQRAGSQQATAAGGPDRASITRRLALWRAPADLPVAGRPPAPAADESGGTPSSGPGAPDTGHPLPLRFTGRDGTP